MIMIIEHKSPLFSSLISFFCLFSWSMIKTPSFWHYPSQEDIGWMCKKYEIVAFAGIFLKFWYRKSLCGWGHQGIGVFALCIDNFLCHYSSNITSLADVSIAAFALCLDIDNLDFCFSCYNVTTRYQCKICLSEVTNVLMPLHFV